MTESRNFENDLNQSNNPKLLEQWNIILKEHYGQNSVITNLEKDKKAQLTYGTDLVIQTPKGRKWSVDPKTKSTRYTDIPLEIIHHRYTDPQKTKHLGEKPGWIYTSTTDLVLMGTKDQKGIIINAVAFSLQPFKDKAFSNKLSAFEMRFSPTTFPNGTFQLTGFYPVPKDFLKEHAHTYWEWPKQQEEPKLIGGTLNEYL